jgi:hypothetical protein
MSFHIGIRQLEVWRLFPYFYLGRKTIRHDRSAGEHYL